MRQKSAGEVQQFRHFLWQNADTVEPGIGLDGWSPPEWFLPVHWCLVQLDRAMRHPCLGGLVTLNVSKVDAFSDAASPPRTAATRSHLQLPPPSLAQHAAEMGGWEVACNRSPLVLIPPGFYPLRLTNRSREAEWISPSFTAAFYGWSPPPWRRVTGAEEYRVFKSFDDYDLRRISILASIQSKPCLGGA